MRFFITTTIAIAIASSFASCSSDVNIEPTDDNVATIQFYISSDDDIDIYNTRTLQTADNTKWFAQIGTEAQGNVNDLVGKTFTPGEYSIKVSNFPDIVSALEYNNGIGTAYYEATQQVTLAKGLNTVSIACGKAQNSKISVNWDGTNDVQGLSMTNVVASQQTENRSYTFASSESCAFFYANSDIQCVINYNYNGTQKTVTKTISNPQPATEYKLVVTANSNGTIITMSVTYDDEFTDGGTTSTEIDAATGEEVITNN